MTDPGFRMPRELKAVDELLRQDVYAPKPRAEEYTTAVDLVELDDTIRQHNEPLDVLAEITSEIGYIPMMDYCKAILATEGWGEAKPEVYQLAAILSAWALKHRAGAEK